MVGRISDFFVHLSISWLSFLTQRVISLWASQPSKETRKQENNERTNEGMSLFYGFSWKWEPTPRPPSFGLGRRWVVVWIVVSFFFVPALMNERCAPMRSRCVPRSALGHYSITIVWEKIIDGGNRTVLKVLREPKLTHSLQIRPLFLSCFSGLGSEWVTEKRGTHG